MRFEKLVYNNKNVIYYYTLKWEFIVVIVVFME